MSYFDFFFSTDSKVELNINMNAIELIYCRVFCIEYLENVEALALDKVLFISLYLWEYIMIV